MTMTIDLTHPGAVAPADGDHPPISLRDVSCDQLRAITERGAHGGDLYFAAAAELERRAHDLEVADEHHQVEVATARRQQSLLLLILALAIVIGATARLFGF